MFKKQKKRAWGKGAVLACLFLALITEPAMAAEEKLVAITFDDGPSVYTSELLKGLASRNVQATFFMTGQNGSHGINNHGNILEIMWEDGHQLANHTYDHPAIGKLGGAAIQNEVKAVNQLIFNKVGGSYQLMMRTPGGANNSTIQANVGAPIILWSVDTWDWKTRNADKVYAQIVNKTHDGSIILLHDLYPTSVSGALRAIDTLQKQGYEFVTVSELMRRRGIVPQNGAIYTNVAPTGMQLAAYDAPTIVSAEENGALLVYMYSADAGLEFYYTLDGTMPNLGSQKYTGPFLANPGETTFRVIGVDKYGTRTPSAWATIQAYYAEKPQAYMQDNNLILFTETEDTEIYYTLDGTMPSRNAFLYENGIPITSASMVQCIAVKEGMVNSPVLTCTITEYGDMYEDILPTDWYYNTVADIVHSGLMTGMGPAEFAPNTEMSKAMVIAALHRFAGSPEVASQATFGDVGDREWYASAFAWAQKNEIIEADENGNVNPDTILSRQELAQLLYQYASKTGSVKTNGEAAKTFSDWNHVDENNQAAMIWCVENGILSGTGDNQLSPSMGTTRAQCAAVLLRMQTYLETQPKSFTQYMKSVLQECGSFFFGG